MTVRVLRIGAKPPTSDLDGVTNPQLLAHRLLNLDKRVEDKGYSRRLRLSGIAGVCVRERLLGLRHGISFKQTTDIGLTVTFDFGTAAHGYFQNAPEYFGKSLIGWWRCEACRHKVFGRRQMVNCSKCGALPAASRYAEHMLRLPEDVPAVGHPDAFLEIAQGDIRIAELKSIAWTDFSKLSAPQAEHAMQVTGYMHYSGMDETLPIRVNQERGLIIYISKSCGPGSTPFKAFHVEKNPIFLSHIHEKVDLFKRGLEDESFLPAPLSRCLAVEFQRSPATSCPVVNLCRDAG